MIIEHLRSLLYPIGFIANLLFGLRFLIQWMGSERKKKSHVTSSFWILSLFANIMMALHAWVQLQFPIFITQGLNGAIAWRNLNLMGKRPYSLKKTLVIFTATLFLINALFIAQGLFSNHLSWMRPPTLPWSGKHAQDAPFLWHLLGLIGIFLFASRFWIQWWLAEKHQKSFLGKSFWWLSTIGASLSLAYFLRLQDYVNIIGFSIGLIPYIRNLVLIKKTPVATQEGNPKKIFLFAGEQSGDILGGKLVTALRHTAPSLDLYGVGGEEMQKAGMHCFKDLRSFQVMGFTDVFKALPRLYGEFQQIKTKILQDRPGTVVFIDYPDFNMRLAKSLRKSGYSGKLVHYVCPSVWAWRKKRISSLTKTLDLLLSILPFEHELFSNTTLPVSYVGHPLVAAIEAHTYDTSWRIKCSIKEDEKILAIFPGSRRHEILLNLPIQLKTAEKLLQEDPNWQIAISIARPDLSDAIDSVVSQTQLSPSLVPNHYRYELMQEASAALATSGTIVMEIGLHALPTVVTYQLAPLNYYLGRYIFRIRLPFYTLVNIICDKEVFPEFIHKVLSVDEIYAALKQTILYSKSCQLECARMRELLQKQDASEKAAQEITHLIAFSPIRF